MLPPPMIPIDADDNALPPAVSRQGSVVLTSSTQSFIHSRSIVHKDPEVEEEERVSRKRSVGFTEPVINSHPPAVAPTEEEADAGPPVLSRHHTVAPIEEEADAGPPVLSRHHTVAPIEEGADAGPPVLSRHHTCRDFD